MSRKIKVFLGGYINLTNAQNLNCRALAQYLDKERFEVTTMTIFYGNLDAPAWPGVRYLNCWRPWRLSRFAAYLRGLAWCDVAYLPKNEAPEIVQWLNRLLKRPAFTTIESIIDTPALPKAMRRRFTAFGPNCYSITRFMRHHNRSHASLDTHERVLYLGTDTSAFLNETPRQGRVNSVIMVGNDLVRKGIDDYLDVAEALPELHFHIVGTGNQRIDMDAFLAKRQLPNITWHGGLSSTELAKLLDDVDLHFLPSRSEGFPKVTLETASAGIPSILYPDYGADEWINHDENGFIVRHKQEAILLIKRLIDEPQTMIAVSAAARQLGKSFDWSVRIRAWEEEIERLARGTPG